ncbi:uncharacterized protein LOC119746051 [Patiria miniata]|uniref:Uncharacterized protein n=1 Tax=Patiria miniata TaxID=46514 RepID=A0A914BRF6_PATMI|nr:uncharacterized protein LOC119746051 [Patiria miniata]
MKSDAIMETSMTPNLTINEKDVNKVDLGPGLLETKEEIVSVSKTIAEDTPSSILSNEFPRVISFDHGNLNTNKFGMSTKCHIVKEGTELKDLTRSAFRLMHEKVRQFGHSHLASIYSPCNALIDRVQLGCVKFVLRFNTKEGLQKFWEMYSSGELAQKMTEVFITDELVPGDKTDISVLPTIEQKDFEAGMKYFEDLEEAEKEAEERRRLRKEKKAMSGEQSSGQDQEQPGTSEMSDEEESPDTSEYEDSMEYSDEEK